MRIPPILCPHVIMPLGHHPYTEQEAREWCGLIPYWVSEALLNGLGTARDVYDYCCGRYGFFTALDDRGHCDPDGTYHYPDDPDLHPLMTLTPSDTVKVHVYLYGLVSFVDSENQLHTRMD